MTSQRRSRSRSSSMKRIRCHGSEREIVVGHGNRLPGRAEQHRHAMRVAVPDLHVLGADVLGAAVPVVVGVVGVVAGSAA